MKKLSESLSVLSVKAKNVEDKIANAETETKESLTEMIAQSKASLELKKEDFIAKVDSVKADAQSKNTAFKEKIHAKIEFLKADAKAKKAAMEQKVDEKKHEIKLAIAEQNYYDAEEYAEDCIDWAIIALANVEEATLEAFKMKLEYEGLKNA
jgi:hypothetical protein